MANWHTRVMFSRHSSRDVISEFKHDVYGNGKCQKIILILLTQFLIILKSVKSRSVQYKKRKKSLIHSICKYFHFSVQTADSRRQKVHNSSDGGRIGRERCLSAKCKLVIGLIHLVLLSHCRLCDGTQGSILFENW